MVIRLEVKSIIFKKGRVICLYIILVEVLKIRFLLFKKFDWVVQTRSAYT